MAACNFSIPFSGEATGVLAKAKAAVQKQGGTFTGDTNSGQFGVSVFGNDIAGSYTVTGNNMNIVIDSKPFLVPCSAIEGFLKSQIAG
ncbi:MAG: hypothetical protein JWP88_1667 [Flaviaesturariibacter sp.]|nr:hypothetical protein [Flaviaesturariibacter sp.]